MPINSHIEDPASGRCATVSQTALHIVSHPAPPTHLGPGLEIIPFRSFFTTAAGSSDLIVDGSSVPVEFSVGANLISDQNRDRYITTISILLSDSGLEAGLFGALATLTNGLSFEFFHPAIGTVVIDDAIKRNVDFIRLALGQPPVAVAGTGAEYTIGQVSAAPDKAEAYIPVIDLRRTFGLDVGNSGGVRLPAGSEAKLTFCVRDALAGLVEFNIIAYGFEHLLDAYA